MVRHSIAATLLLITLLYLSETAMAALPTAHYHPKPDDPSWMATAAQFHGHLGPWAAAAVRIGMAGRQAVGATGYFDIDVTATGPFAKPPKACFLDGLQVATGATWGKRNIHWVEGDRIIVRFRNTRTGKVVEVRPTAELMKYLATVNTDLEQHERDDQALEAIVRKIAKLPDAKVAIIEVPDKESSNAE